MGTAFQREKITYLGDSFCEVDIIPMSDGMVAYAKSGRKRKKVAVTAPKQQKLNDRRARRYLTQLIQANFGTGNGMHLSLTYADCNLPATVEEAEEIAEKYMRRVRYLYSKSGCELKYILITSSNTRKATGELVRCHHHIIIGAAEGLSLAEYVPESHIVHPYGKLVNLWRSGRSKKDKPAKMYGSANCDPLLPDENGVVGLIEYLFKQPRESLKRRWRASKNLKKPITYDRPNDTRYTRRQIAKLIRQPPCREYWEKKYPGWTVDVDNPWAYQTVDNEWSGAAIYLKMRRKI